MSSACVSDYPLVSVIVPVYDVEDYLVQCIESIRCQTYPNIEIILVDDGSKDSSGAICDRYALLDDRIKVIHKTNAGLSDARNTGLLAATGTWVSFVDSDDYISLLFIEALLLTAIQLECPICAIPFGCTFSETNTCDLITNKKDLPQGYVLSSKDAQRLMLYQALDTAAQWRLYRRDVLGDNPFPVGLYYEDLAAVYRIIHKVERIAVLDCVNLYAYRQRKNSIIRQDYSPLKAKSALSISEQLYREINLWYPDLSAAASSRCFSVCRMVYAQVPLDDKNNKIKKDKESLWAALVTHRRTVLRDHDARMRERLAALISYGGEGVFGLFCKACCRIGLMR